MRGATDEISRSSPATIFTFYCFNFGRSQASTILVGSIAALSTCSSLIRPSFPMRKFTRRAALYWSE